MQYSDDFFEENLHRENSDCTKWTHYGRDVLPLWIADMDFRTAPEITDALVRRANEGCYGYAKESKQTVAALVAYHRDVYGWDIDPDWVVPLPGIVTGLNLFCKLLHETRPDRDGVVINLPVYHHFMEAAALQHCTQRTVRLNIGTPALPQNDADIPAEGAAGWMLCNPQNPLGFCWQPDELHRILRLAEQYDFPVVSDEIHGGLVLDEPYTYHPLLNTLRKPEERQRTLAFLAPSKTFNLPGLGCAFAVIPNATYREFFTRDYGQMVPLINIFGWVGAKAAYQHGEPWRLAMLRYLRGNRSLLQNAAAEWKLPLCKLNATYLGFLDCRSLIPSLNGESPHAFFLRHGVALNDGAMFGAPGWVRINIATRRALLKQALERMGNAIASLTRRG